MCTYYIRFHHASSRYTFHIVISFSFSLYSKQITRTGKRTPWRHVKRTSHAAEPHIRSHRDNKDIHTCAADLQPLLLDVSSGRPSEAVRSSSPLIVQLLSTLLFLVSPDVQALCFSSFPFAVDVSRSVVLAVMLFVRLSMRDTRAHSSRIIYISHQVSEESREQLGHTGPPLYTLTTGGRLRLSGPKLVGFRRLWTLRDR